MEYTTIEQSQKLLALGLKKESADMYYFMDPTPVGSIYVPSLMFVEKHLKSRMPEYTKGDIPCWSLGALEKVMPSFQSNKYVGKYNYEFIKDEWSNGPDYRTDSYDNPIDAAYEMVCWLLEKGYIKK